MAIRLSLESGSVGKRALAIVEVQNSLKLEDRYLEVKIMENPPQFVSSCLEGLVFIISYRRWRIKYCCLVNLINEGLG